MTQPTSPAQSSQMTKATAQAYSNIALVKYWGKGDEQLRLPVNSSLAIGLDSIFTTTTVEFQPELPADEVKIDGDEFNQAETQRVTDHLDLVRAQAGITTRAKVVTKNNFPKGVGAASSASGFAALSMAAATAAGLQLSPRELSVLARQGSGSASRSIPGSFSVWHKGTDSASSFAEPVAYPAEWDLRILLVFVGDLKAKKIGSTEGMALTSQTSPYYQLAISQAEANIERLSQALSAKDWAAFGQVIEDECFRLHMLCMTTQPNILYWSAETVAIFQQLLTLRTEGVTGYFTVDAGPHVHVICQAAEATTIRRALETIPGIHQIVECGVGGPAHLVETPLF